MVFIKRSIKSTDKYVPIDISFDVNPHEILQDVSQQSMVGILEQISNLFVYTNQIFSDLTEEAKKTSDKIVNLGQRVESVSAKLIEVEGYVPYQKTQDCFEYLRVEFTNSCREDAQQFTEENRPESTKIQYNDCNPPPNLGLLDEYAETSCEKKYTNPDFFFEAWCAEQQKQYEEAKKKRREERKNRRKNAPRKKANTERKVVKQVRLKRKELSAMGAEFGESSDAIAVNTPTINNNNNTSTSSISSDSNNGSSSSNNLPPPTIESQSSSGNLKNPKNKSNKKLSKKEEKKRKAKEEKERKQREKEEKKRKQREEKEQKKLKRKSKKPPKLTTTPSQSNNLTVDNDQPPSGPPLSSSSSSNNNSSSSSSSKQPKSSPPPPAPAPPPPPPAPGPPPPVNNTPKAPSAAGLSSALGNVSLNKTEIPQKPVNARSNLLSSIQSGIKLKKVEQKEKENVAKDSHGFNVARILERRAAIEFSDDSSDSDWSDDDW
eukprot:TRINITY_DN4589_c0_g1_i1.p1 TRINITY_DN4589_c0_g1~~TRINITY_DN4589_c0_g1_i1.p1  ORF type:complete len:490 (+),score=215.96 TRINITY_DN4589_c0_g1_i1:49-1518(+)